jgi:hypothetical protein
LKLLRIPGILFKDVLLRKFIEMRNLKRNSKKFLKKRFFKKSFLKPFKKAFFLKRFKKKSFIKRLIFSYKNFSDHRFFFKKYGINFLRNLFPKPLKFKKLNKTLNFYYNKNQRFFYNYKFYVFNRFHFKRLFFSNKKLSFLHSKGIWNKRDLFFKKDKMLSFNFIKLFDNGPKKLNTFNFLNRESQTNFFISAGLMHYSFFYFSFHYKAKRSYRRYIRRNYLHSFKQVYLNKTEKFFIQGYFMNKTKLSFKNNCYNNCFFLFDKKFLKCFLFLKK